MLSPAIEDYLKTIYKLQAPDGTGVSTSDISRAMDVAPSSASNMVKRLAGLKLVEYRAYRGVVLTEAGEKIALEIIRHHRLLETYLREVMGFDWDQMHAEAELLEHHISEEFEDRIEALLGYPTHDPHGDPIPSRDGVVPTIPAVPLSPVHVGKRVVIVRLTEQDPELLTRFEQAGLLPGARILVSEAHSGDDAPTESGLMLEGPTGSTERVTIDVAKHLLVRVDVNESSSPDSVAL